jgi:hypothetical protein
MSESAVEPLRIFFHARNESGVVAAVRKTALFWEMQRHEHSLTAESTNRDSARAEQNATSSIIIQNKPNSSDSQTGVPTPHGVDVKVGVHSVTNNELILAALGLEFEPEETSARDIPTRFGGKETEQYIEQDFEHMNPRKLKNSDKAFGKERFSEFPDGA